MIKTKSRKPFIPASDELLYRNPQLWSRLIPYQVGLRLVERDTNPAKKSVRTVSRGEVIR